MSIDDNDGNIELFDLEDRNAKDEIDQEVDLTPPAEVTEEQDYTMPNLHMGSNDPRVTREEMQRGPSGQEELEVREGHSVRVSVSQELVEIAQAGSGLTGIPANLGSLDELEDAGDGQLHVVINNIPAGVQTSVGVVQEDGSIVVTAAEARNLFFIVEPDAEVEAFEVVAVVAPVEDGDVQDDAEDNNDETLAAFEEAADTTASSPGLDVSAASGAEDTAIDLDITAGLTDNDGSESLSVVVNGVPDGALLSAGTDNGDGSWNLSASDLSGLTITPADNFDGAFDLVVTATSTESDGGATSSTTRTVTVDVSAEADAAELSLTASLGVEDQTIALNINVSADDDISSITIDGVPEGASLSAGTVNEDGSWSLSSDDLSGLTITIAENTDVDFALDVSVTTVDGDETATVSDTLDVRVAADADAPTLVLSGSSGDEDTAIAVNIDARLTDTDGSETLAITVEDVPDGASLSAGTDNGDGSWSLTQDDLDGLTITPAANFSGTIDLTVTATSNDGDDSSAVSATTTVEVDAVADTANLSVTNTSGSEDSAIALSIDASLTDTDGSEVLQVVVTGVPEGATLSAGSDNGDGSWTLASDELEGLTVSPPQNFSGSFDLGVAVTTVDGDDTSTITGSATVDVSGVADGSIISTSDANGSEDNSIALNVSVDAVDTSETLDIVISGVPAGATLSAGTDAGDGNWQVSQDDLEGLSITPPANSSADFTLTVTTTTSETESGATATNSQSLDVDVSGVADQVTLEVAVGKPADISVDLPEDGGSALHSVMDIEIDAGLADGDGSETLSVIIEGLPEGAALSAGTDNGDGSWTLQQSDIEDLTVRMLPDDVQDFAMTVSATATETDGDSISRTRIILVDADDDGSFGAATEGTANNDRLIGGEGSDVFDGGAGSDRIYAGEGADYVDGGDGRDSISGGAGDDVLFGGSGRDSLRGDAGIDTLSGGADNDSLSGGEGADVLAGDEGNDTLVGGAGADELRGGTGNDRLYVDGDDTVIEGGDGIDRIDVQGEDGVSFGEGASIETAVGNVGDDSFDGSDLETRATYYGRDGDDALAGGTAADRLYGDAGDDALDGGAGNDTLVGGAGADELHGGEGNDRLYVDGDDTVIEGGDGIDRIDVQGEGGVSFGEGASIETAVGNVGDDSFDGSDLETRATYYGRDGDDELTGGSAADRLYGDDGDDQLSGGAGNDSLNGGAGADELVGGAGNDRIYADGADTVVDGGEGTDRVDVVGDADFSLNLTEASVEQVYANAGDDTLDASGSTERVTAYGRAGDDTISGGENRDNLRGDAGNDTISGGAENDAIYGGDGNDVLSGDDGNDTLRGDAGADELRGGAGNDRLIVDADDTVILGGEGIDRMDVQGTGGVSIGAGAGIETAYGNVGDDSFDGSDLETRATFYGRAGDDELTGGSAADRLYGDDGDDKLVGNDGNDSLSGGAGADELIGGAGNDRLYIDGDDTVVSGGDGTDRVDVVDSDGVSLDMTDASVEQAFGNVGNDTFDASGSSDRITAYGRAGDDNITGGDNRDNLRGDAGDDTISGGGGADSIYGGDGADELSGDAGNDYLRGDAGADELSGGEGADRLYGGTDGDTLDGGAGNDRLYGQDGNDTLDGGAGNDILDGGAGDDLFIFGAGNGVDTVHGGDGWLDAVRLQGDGSPLGAEDFAISLSSGSIEDQADNYVALSEDAAGTVTFNDGSELHFDGLERIEW